MRMKLEMSFTTIVYEIYKSSFHKIKSKLFMSDMTIIRESARYCFKIVETYNEIDENI